MKFLSFIISILILFFMYGFYLAQNNILIIPDELKRENSSLYYDYAGVINVRTDLSNGSSDPQIVIQEAKKTGLDFLILTDANQIEKIDSFEGYHSGMMVFVEDEFSYLDMRLLHLSGGSEDSFNRHEQLNTYLADQISQSDPLQRDNIIIMAQPYNNGPTWTGNFPTGINGLEIINSKNLSQRAWQNSKLSVIWSLLNYPFNPKLSFLRLFQEPSEEIMLWDSILKDHFIVGYSGSDASARAIPFSEYLLKFPSYQRTFEIAKNHILLETELNGNFTKDKETLYKALKKGQFYFSIDLLGNPKGFVSYIEYKDKTFPIGSHLKLKKDMYLKAKIPIEPKDFYEIVIYKNGDRELTVNQPNIEYEIKEPGIYRVVVRVSAFLPIPDAKKWITWIYTNPFVVLK